MMEEAAGPAPLTILQVRSRSPTRNGCAYGCGRGGVWQSSSRERPSRNFMCERSRNRATHRPHACALHLQAHGIPAADIKKLIEGGVHTLEALAHAPKRELTAIKGLSEAKVEKLQKEGRARMRASILQHLPALALLMLTSFVSLCACPAPCTLKQTHVHMQLHSAAWKLVPMGFTTASIVAEQRAELIKVTSGCKELDSILEGAAISDAAHRSPRQPCLCVLLPHTLQPCCAAC
jgi:Helix-hairpin-helix domain